MDWLFTPSSQTKGLRASGEVLSRSVDLQPAVPSLPAQLQAGKSSTRRLLTQAGLGPEYWSYACSYNPHEREELLRMVNMINDFSALEWLVDGGPQTPKSASEHNDAETPGMASGDINMAPVDPYFDDDEEEITRLKPL
eukprot:6491106-Amphidinium_carterae.1